MGKEWEDCVLNLGDIDILNFGPPCTPWAKDEAEIECFADTECDEDDTLDDTQEDSSCSLG